MQHNNDVQRTEQWFLDRMGIPTASRFKDVLTQPRTKKDKDAGVLSEVAMTYAFELITERLTKTHREINAKSLVHGKETESEAVDFYTQITGENVMQCGFIKHPSIACGASPDGLLGIDGGLEIKCPSNPAIHLKNLFRQEVPKEYMPQVQGQMMVGDLEFVDFASYNNLFDNDQKMMVVRVFRDECYIRNLELRLIEFNEKLEEFIEYITSSNHIERAA